MLNKNSIIECMECMVAQTQKIIKMKKFKKIGTNIMVLVTNERNSNYAVIRMEVRGCRTKPSNLLGWESDVYYGNMCYLPESVAARKLLREFVNGKKFKCALMRHINAKYGFNTTQEKQELFDNVLMKINTLIDKSFFIYQ